MNSVVPCEKGPQCSWPACSADCPGRPGMGVVRLTAKASAYHRAKAGKGRVTLARVSLEGRERDRS